jgi:sphingomyelin phosphodiesterase
MSGAPAFRIYTVDPITFGVLDATTYAAALPASASAAPVWRKYYSAKAAYGPLARPPVTGAAAELTPAFWHTVTAAFELDDAAFQAYYARKNRRANATAAACVGSCKAAEICQLRAAQAQFNCVAVTPVITFSKRNAHGHGHGHAEMGECQGSVARPILAQLAGRQGVLQEALQRAMERAKKV